MGCNETVRVYTLNEGDAWKLFLKILREPLPSNITEIAKSITTKCGGLPLGIKTMAGSMRGVDDVCEWRNALVKLQDSKSGEIDEEDVVYKVLKFSYNSLSNFKLQKCFLYCALFLEDHKIYRWKLIEHLIDGQVIVGENRVAQLDEGRSILNKLERVCLLEGGDYKEGRYVKMHDLIRDMAIKIMQTDQTTLVEAGKQLTEMPEKEKWAENIVSCSLMDNYIRKIPPGYSPKCPNLSTLLLSGNCFHSIPASFFEKLDGLKVLDLSYTYINELPSSISYLVNLSALLLQECVNLHHLSSLEYLLALKKLDLRKSGIGQVPHGIQFLLELRYLDLRGTRIDHIPSGILSNLSNLQFLSLGSITIAAEDLAKLVKLEFLARQIQDVSEFNSITTANVTHFSILVGEADEWSFERMDEEYNNTVYINGSKINSATIPLPRNVEELSIKSCHSETNDLCLQNGTKLKQFTIKRCRGIVSLFFTDIFQSLEKIDIGSVNDLEFMFSREATIPQSPPLSAFPLLKEFIITGCPKIKQLFPLASFSNLQSLEKIVVNHCKSMEELIAMEEEEEGSHHSIEFTLPKLMCLRLVGLPELKSICSRRLICNSLQEINVKDCLKLKQIPVSLMNLQSLKMIHVENCRSVEELIAMEEEEEGSHHSFEFTLPKLMCLRLVGLPELKSICSRRLICNSLQKIDVKDCLKLKQIPVSLINHQNLYMIHVENCRSMEELIAMEEEEEGSHHSIEFTLPKLMWLSLVGLPELKSICSRRLICNSLREIDVKDCLKLKQIPYPLPSLQRIRVYPRENWDSFEFEHPDAKNVCAELESIMNKFWWGSSATKRNIHWMSWQRLSRAKKEGGLAFKMLREFNIALLGKMGWKMIKEPDALVTKLLKAKYFPNCHFLEAPIGSNPSYIWRSIRESQHVVKMGYCWKVGRGCEVNIWRDPWLRDNNPFVTTPFNPNFGVVYVNDLIDDGRWKVDLIFEYFNERDARIIIGMPLINGAEDDVVWRFEGSGCYSVKSAYAVLVSNPVTDADLDMNRLWSRCWSIRVPPQIRNFIWRALNGILPTRQNLRRRRIDVPAVCPLCNQHVESIDHLLVQCCFAKQVWQCSFLGWFAPATINFKDWVGRICGLFNDNDVATAFTVCWQIWNCRNDLIWNHKSFSAMAVWIRAWRFLEEWRNASAGPVNAGGTAAARKWQKPGRDWVKVNVDAAGTEREGFAGYGVAVRDFEGQLVGVKVGRVSAVLFPKEAEAMAIKEALSWVEGKGWAKVIVESDNLVAI